MLRRGLGLQALWACALILAGSAFAQDVPAYALVKGTVFTSQGRSLPGVEIEIRRIDLEEERERRRTRIETVSDRIGEFALRLPAGPALWEVSFSARDFKTEKREIEIVNDERVDLTILLQPEG